MTDLFSNIAPYTHSTSFTLLFLRTDSIGDSVLAIGMLPILKQKYPAARIIVCCHDHIAELYKPCPAVDEIITFNRLRIQNDKQYCVELLSQIQGLHADLVINSVYSREVLTDVFAAASDARQMIAFDGDLCNISAEKHNHYNQHYTTLINSPGAWKLELDRYQDFIRFFGINCGRISPQLWLNLNDKQYVDSLIQKYEFDPDKTIILFAGAQIEIRIYTHYGTALASVCESHGYTVIAVGGANEYSLNQSQLDVIKTKTINLCGMLTLMQTAALIKRCALAVGAETGTAHIACAVGTPNVILIGGGHYGRFMPYSALTTLVCLPLDCYRCNWCCKYTRNFCIKDINPDLLCAAICYALEIKHHKIKIFAQQRYAFENYSDTPRVLNSLLNGDGIDADIVSTIEL